MGGYDNASPTRATNYPPDGWGLYYAIVNFETSSKDYFYWVSAHWGVGIGDRLEVITPSNPGGVEVTVKNVVRLLSKDWGTSTWPAMTMKTANKLVRHKAGKEATPAIRMSADMWALDRTNHFLAEGIRTGLDDQGLYNLVSHFKEHLTTDASRQEFNRLLMEAAKKVTKPPKPIHNPTCDGLEKYVLTNMEDRFSAKETLDDVNALQKEWGHWVKTEEGKKEFDACYQRHYERTNRKEAPMNPYDHVSWKTQADVPLPTVGGDPGKLPKENSWYKHSNVFSHLRTFEQLYKAYRERMWNRQGVDDYDAQRREALTHWYKERYLELIQREGMAPTLNEAEPREKESMGITNDTYAIKVEQRTYVTLPGLGTNDVKNLTEDQVINAIKQTEDKIEELSKLKTKPKSLQARIEKYQEGIKALTDYLDAKFDAEQAAEAAAPAPTA